MEVLIVLIAVVGVSIYLYNLWSGGANNRPPLDVDSEIVVCASCRNRMTRGAFERYSGCPLCRSDIFYSTGEYAE